MNYLIFGGSGFIGTHLTNLINSTEPEANIYNLDIVENNSEGKSTFIECDVRNIINLDLNLSSNDIIFNLAAVHRTPGHPDNEYFETNIKGAENICNFATKHQIQKIVFTSSIAPYGAGEQMKTEDTLTTPNTPYGISKLVAEKIHQTWQVTEKNRSLLIVRPGVVFGKGENGNFTRLYWGLKKGQFFYPGRKDTIKASIYVKDLVSFMFSQIKHQKNSKELYNCTYEPAFTIEQIVQSMVKVTNLNKKPITINAGLLLFASTIIGCIGGKKLGIHPDRVKKLMISTNINGQKLKVSSYKLKYSLDDAIKDWYQDNDNQYLK